MKPKFIITALELKQNYSELPRIDSREGIGRFGRISFDLEISIQGAGDFSKYIKRKKINNAQIMSDILMGKLKLVGCNKI